MLNVAAASLELVSIFLCINYIYDRKYKMTMYDAGFFVLELALMGILNLYKPGRSFIILVYILIFVYQEVKFRKGFRKTFVNTMLLSFFEVTFQLICSILVFLEKYITIEYLLIVSNTLLVTLTYVLGKIGLIKKISDISKKRELLMNVVTLVCFFISVYLVIVNKFSECLRYTDYFIFGACSVILCLIVFKWQKTIDEKRMKEKELEIHKIYNDTTMQLIRSVRNRQHEFDNHMQAILGQQFVAATLEELIERQNEYYKDIEEDNHYNKLLTAGTSTVIGFLYSKFLYAESMGCEVDYTIRAGTLSCAMPYFRIIEILGIFIDNAIEAQMEKEEKLLEVEILEDAALICIEVRNPCGEAIPNSRIQKFLQEGFSTKGADRGRGLSNVTNITREYGAGFYIRSTEYNEIPYIVFKVIINK